jgi:DNA-binding NarL/FixJ family response regulator
VLDYRVSGVAFDSRVADAPLSVGSDMDITPASSERTTTTRAVLPVMILYDDPVIAAGLAAVLREHGSFQIIPAAEPGDLLDGAPPADLVVLADYETALRLAHTASRWVKNMMIFTGCDSEAKICRAIETGARGYLLHGIGLTELFEGIRTICSGGVALSPKVTMRITNHIRGGILTARERSVLEQMMLGLSNKSIAQRLTVCVGTVKSHVKSIMVKLGADSRTAAVVMAQSRGILL